MYVYIIRYPSFPANHYKIGISKDPKRRFRQFNTAHSSDPEIVLTYETKHYEMVEKIVHYTLREYNVRNEHFDVSLDRIKSEITRTITFLDKGKIEVNNDLIDRINRIDDGVLKLQKKGILSKLKII